MAEAVGIIAASGQFVEQSIKIFKLAKKVQNKFVDAPDELEDWRNELESLQQIVDRILKTPALHTDNLERIVTECKRVSEKLLDIFSNIDFNESDSFAHKSWRVVVSLAKEEEICELFNKLERCKSTLNAELASSGAIQLAQVNEGFARTASALDEIKRFSRPGTDEDRCIRSLFVTDPLSDREGLVTIKGHRTRGTFEWIPNTSQYRDWEANQNGLLWISGPPGKGKTMISIFLSKRLETNNQDGTVIWFFCDNKTASRNSAVNVVRGLMTQLIMKHPRVLSFLLPTWKVQQDKTFHANSFETLWRIFLSMLAALKNEKVYCVLDALDECDDESLSSLLFKIKTLFDPLQNDDARNSLKLIIASREYPLSLPQNLSGFLRIALDDLDHDIQLYIAEKVDHLSRVKNFQGSPLQRRIESALREGTEGTFLWVSYVAQDLEQKTLDEIDTAVNQLPRGLYAIYDRIISKIENETRGGIVEMLRWILLAARPLTISELCNAIDVKPTDFLTREQVCLGYVQSCGHLLQLQTWDEVRRMWVACREYDMNSVQDSQGTIAIGKLATTLLHQSAKDFFLRQEATSLPFALLVDTQKGHTVIIERLFALLEAQLCSKPLIPLLSENVGSFIQKNQRFFGKASKLRDLWWEHSSPKILEPPTHVPLLHMACAENLYYVVLLEQGANVSITNKREESSLHQAMHRLEGFDATTYKLLSTSRTARRIFKKEAKHDEKSPTRRSLLHSAAVVGDCSICRELIEVWQYSNEQVDWMGWKPVHYALGYGHIHLFHHMATHWFADLEPHSDLFKAVMSLGWPGQGSFVESFKTLIGDLGCDINTTDAEGSTIFHHRKFVYEVMQIVNELGVSVDWNKQNSEGETFIHSNLMWLIDPRLLIVYMQQSQLSINARDNRGRTPLNSYPFHSAAFYYEDQFDVRMLLDFGADRHLADNDGKTALDTFIKARDNRRPWKLRSERIDFLDEAIKLLSSYSTVPIDPRKVDLNHDSRKWLDPIDWDSISP
ncbi:hypothetical protein FAVG1_06440 [Fusarium avenaceum]|nr:hypothetical protein FAVG1_06440 [Fusarium avenaceum]